MRASRRAAQRGAMRYAACCAVATPHFRRRHAAPRAANVYFHAVARTAAMLLVEGATLRSRRGAQALLARIPCMPRSIYLLRVMRYTAR